MEERKQFTFYGSFWEAIKELPAKYQLPTLRAIICYALFQEEPTSLPPTCRAVFLLVKPTLDASRKKAASGKQGGQAGKQTGSKPEANRNQTPREKESKKEKEIEIEGENDKRSTPQAPPPDPHCHPERNEGTPAPQPPPCRPEEGVARREDPSPSTYAPVGRGLAPAATTATAPFNGKAFTAFWEAYPSKIDRDAAWEAWKTLSPDRDTAEKIMSALAVWKGSDQWQEDSGRFIPRASKFLTKGYWTAPPSPKQSEPADRQLDDDETAAIRRLMSEPLGSPSHVIARSASDAAIPTPSAAPLAQLPEDQSPQATESAPVGASIARPFPADADVPTAIRTTQGGAP
ncbi:MAG: hypothetical protein II290_02750 [Oscillospiraceae bacterium]|nr:hypothetical protein [Oscillospiraceae bacterium]